MAYEVAVGGTVRRVEVEDAGGGRWRVTLDGEAIEVDARFPEPGVVNLLRDGDAYELDVIPTDAGRDVTLYGTRYEIAVVDERTKALLALAGGAAGRSGKETIGTSMPGKVVALLVEEGQSVSEGDGIVVVEAMKMENELRCTRAGVVETVHVAVGDAVTGGAPLVVIAPAEAS